MILFTTWFGTFLYEDEGVVKSNLFPKDAKEIARRLNSMAEGKILKEEKQLSQGLSRFLVLDDRLGALGGEIIEEDIPDISPKDFGLTEDILHEAMMILAKEKTDERVTKDEAIGQAVSALDDLVQSANLLSERLHEWYGMHFPQQRRVLSEGEFIELVVSECRKGKSEDKTDLEPISELALLLGSIHKKKKVLEEFIKTEMDNNIPNMSYLVGPIIGARLMAKAGGLTRLSRLPSGTIQVLGAEKALFRHLKEGSDPPKHGLIFQHPLVHRAPYWQRGKIARAFASKIAIAAKLDEHSDKSMGEELKKVLLDRIEEIKTKYPAPGKKGKKKRK